MISILLPTSLHRAKLLHPHTYFVSLVVEREREEEIRVSTAARCQIQRRFNVVHKVTPPSHFNSGLKKCSNFYNFAARSVYVKSGEKIIRLVELLTVNLQLISFDHLIV